MSLLYEKETYLIRKAIFEVYKEAGYGLFEEYYHRSLEKKFKKLFIPYKSKTEFALYYDGNDLNLTLIPDFICFDKVLVEVKATKKLIPAHTAQVLTYLKVTNLRLALLVNFGGFPKAEIKRIIL